MLVRLRLVSHMKTNPRLCAFSFFSPILYSLGLLLCYPKPVEASPQFQQTGNLTSGRYWHTETLLNNGKVLVAGGIDERSFPMNNSQLYDPATGTWTNTGRMTYGRYHHTATLLPNGKVLVTGGATNPNGQSSTAELYDPASGTWALTGSECYPYGRTQRDIAENGEGIGNGWIRIDVLRNLGTL